MGDPNRRSGNEAPSAQEDPCIPCEKYATHFAHRGVVYQIRSHPGRNYVRHFVSCPCSPEEEEREDEEEAEPPALPLFDGFPYLCTRVVEAVRHIIVLPAGREEEALRNLAREQARANRLETCLVLSAERAIYYSADGALASEGPAPAGGLFVSGRLQAAVDFPKSRELAARRRRLEKFIEARRQTGYMVCGPRTSRREATPEELKSLAGVGPGGIPRGLAACPSCGLYRGLALGQGYAEGWVAEVYCRCQNHNRCARCGGLLWSSRLNGFVYEGGKVLHVPGFSGFQHACPSGDGRIQ